MSKTGFTAGQRWVLGLASAGSFLAALDTLVVATALDTLRHDLSASVEALEWVVNAYNLAFATLLMTAAALGDRFGRRRIYVAGVLLFAAASAACALAPSSGWLIAGRAAQGVFAAVMMALSMSLLGAAFPPAQRAKALGVFSSITGLAVLSGPVVGGAVVHGLAWQWMFWINLPVALVVAWLALFKVPESKGADEPLDLGGVALMTIALLGLVWGLVHGNASGWLSAQVVVALAVGVLVGAAFVVQQRLTPQAMIPARLFRSPVFAFGNASSFLMMAAVLGTLFFMAQFFQVAQGKTALEAGVSLLPWTATLFFVAPVAGSLVGRIGERTLVVVGLSLQAAGLAWLATLAQPDVPYASLVLPLVVTGAGVSMAMPPVQSAVLAQVDPADIGKASGLSTMLRQLGGVFGVAVVVAVFARVGGYGSPQQFSAGFAAALGTCAAFSLAGAALALRLKGRGDAIRLAGVKGANS